MDTGYSAIPIGRILSGEHAPVDIYLKLSDDKFIKVVKKGGYFNRDQLRNYKDHKVETIYVSHIDFPRYVDANLVLLEAVLKNSEMSSNQGLGLSLQVGDTIFRLLEIKGFSDPVGSYMGRFGNLLGRLLEARPQLSGILEELLDLNNSISRHSISVGLLTLMIVRSLKWQVQKNIDALVLAALLHDVSLLKYPMIYQSDRDSWPREIEQIYINHPFESAHVLKESGLINDQRILDVIKDHHELPNGSGFPRELKGAQIHPMALPLIMADRLSHLLLDPKSHLVDRSLGRALRYLKNREEKFYPQSYWEALNSWIS